METSFSIYTLFKGYSSNLIDCVYAVSPQFVKEAFSKRRRFISQSKFSKEEEMLFQNSCDWLEKYLKIAKQLQINGYRLKQVSNYIVWELSNYKKLDITPGSVYPELDTVLSKYHVTLEEVRELVKDMERDKCFCFCHFYGIEKPQLGIEELIEQTNLSPIAVMDSIKLVYSLFEKKQMERQLQSVTTKQEENKVQRSKIYSDIEGLLQYFSITLSDLDEIVANLPRKEKIAMIYFYGLDDRTRMKTKKIASILKDNNIVLDCNELDVANYLYSAYMAIENYYKDSVSIVKEKKKYD